LLLLDGQVHHDTHPIPMGNYVSGAGNYLSANPSDLGNYVSADTQETLCRASARVTHVFGTHELAKYFTQRQEVQAVRPGPAGRLQR
jgi:hypothetical protein